MDKLKMTSENLVERNIEKIAELFPNCVTETVENGEGKRKIDFDLLRQELSSVLVEGKDERYRLDWSGKRQAILTANSPIAKTLRPVKNDEDKPSGADSSGQPYASTGSVGKNGEKGGFDSENLYIEGDNLDALKLLHETYLSKIKMIYIDPPYNTGNDFVYRDDFAEDAEEYLVNSNQQDEQGIKLTTNKETSGRYHSDWLSMMYMRLKIARDLLTDDGVIFISIDDNEVENLLKVCDEIFGGQNRVACIPWQSRLSVQNDTDFSINHEYIVAFAKNRRQENRRLKETNANTWFRKDSFVCKPLPLDATKFDNPDNDPRGPWKADPMDAPHIRPNLTYPIVNPTTGAEYLPPKGRHWRTEKATFEKWFNDGRIIFGKNGTSGPQVKSFYNEKNAFGSIDTSWFSGDKIGTATNATKELQQLFATPPFDTPKPTSMLKKIIDLGYVKSNDIILDFFSGSATTAHAVMQLNAEDGGNRKFIMVQVPENTDEKSEVYKAGYKNICEIGKERIRRAGAKIAEENRLLRPDLDIGFRVLKLDDSNMQDVYYNPGALKQADLFGLQSSIKEDRTAEDVLFQIMLDKGVLLSSQIELKSTQNGKQNYFVVGKSDHDLIDLICCLDSNIDTEAVKEIAQLKPECCVFLDSSMANDSTRTNIEQIFTTYSPNTEVEVI